MNTNSFVFDAPAEGHYQTQWQAPSNIALIKYWGKYGQQLPQNPSISFTLSQCVTTTAVSFSPQEQGAATFDFCLIKKNNPNSPQDSAVFGSNYTLFSCFGRIPLVDFQPKFLSPQQWHRLFCLGHGSLGPLHRRF